MASKKQLHNEIRKVYMDLIKKVLTDNGEDVLLTNSNEFAIPCVDSEGNDEFIVLTFKVPLGSRDGEAYDGYGEAEAYGKKVAEAEAKAIEAKAKKEAKIAKDKAMREQRAKAKAEHEAKGV